MHSLHRRKVQLKWIAAFRRLLSLLCQFRCLLQPELIPQASTQRNKTLRGAQTQSIYTVYTKLQVISTVNYYWSWKVNPCWVHLVFLCFPLQIPLPRPDRSSRAPSSATRPRSAALWTSTLQMLPWTKVRCQWNRCSGELTMSRRVTVVSVVMLAASNA